MNIEASHLWRQCFEPRSGDEHDKPREHLRTALLRFRDRVEPIAADIAISMPGYTDHSILHCDSLWHVADVVTGTEYSMTPTEGFILGGSFLVHDLGMGLAAAGQGGFRNIVDRAEWRDIVFGLYPEDAEELLAQAASDAAQNPTWDAIRSPEIKEALTTYLRLNHASEAASILTRQWTLSNGEAFYLLEDTQLRTWFGEWIGKVAKSHWQDVDDLAAEFAIPMNAPADFPPDWGFDPLKLAGILRCADAAQVDERRANPLHTPIRHPQGDSAAHWQFQEKIAPAICQNDRLVYTSTLFPAEQAKAWWLAWDTLRMVDRELRRVDALFADLDRPRLRAKSVAGVDAPDRFSKYVRPDGWTPIDASPTITNPHSVISNLGGTQLYGRGETTFVALREILANALDATRLSSLAEGVASKSVDVEIDTIGTPNRVVIRDYGVGMSAADMVEFLCDFGKSGWRSTKHREKFRGAMSAGYRSTGQFGIGFYSVFMVAREVVVRSRPFDASAAETIVLTFQEGLDSRPLMRTARPTERLATHGTSVEISLNDKFFDSRTRASRAEMTIDGVAHSLRRLTLLADAPIDLRLNGQGPVGCGNGEPWIEMSPDQLFEVLVDPNGPSARLDPNAFAIAKTQFADLARPILDTQGRKAGMLCFDLGLHEVDRDFRLVVPGESYAGGFQTSRLEGVSGVLSGEPSTASRSHSFSEISPDEIRRWCAEQIELLRTRQLSDATQLEISAHCREIGLELDDLPFLYVGQELITPAEFRGLISSLDLVTIYDTVGTPLMLPDGQRAFWSYRTEDLYQFDSSHISEPIGAYRAFSLQTTVSAVEFPEQWPDLEGVVLEGSNGMEVNDWWQYAWRAEGGTAIREAAKAWEVPIAGLLREIRIEPSYGPNPTAPVFTGLNGRSERISTLHIRRPPK